MANRDAPHGFLPVESNGKMWHAHQYTVDSSNVPTIAKGDLVALEADGNLTRAAAGTTSLVGSVAGILYTDALGVDHPGTYLPTLTAATLFVIDDPDARFQAQADDGGSVACITGYIGENCDIVDTAPTQTGDYAGRSNQEIDISEHQAATSQVRLVDLYRMQTNAHGSSTTDNLNAIYICRINEHIARQIDDGGAIEGGVGIA
jgi:hypothetical protein